MAMHLIDRPYFDHERQDHRRLSAAASMALHVAVIVTLVAALQVSTDKEDSTAITALLPDIVWIPQDMGGGKDRGGDNSIAPPRRAREIGSNEISVPASPPQQASTESIVEPQPEASTLPAQPMGDATQTLVGVIESSGTSAGPGSRGTGDTPGSDRTPGFGEGAYPGGPGVTMPTLIERVAPKYTVGAMQARIQGVAMVECVVLPDGTVGDARIIRSLDPRFGLDEEALAAAKRWRFRPGRLNGKPVAVMVTIELSFSVR